MPSEYRQYFWLKVGEDYIIAESVVAVRRSAVTKEIHDTFDNARPIEARELPGIEDRNYWLWLQVTNPPKPGPGPGGAAGGGGG